MNQTSVPDVPKAAKISVEAYCNYLTRSLKDNNCGENLADIGKTIYEPNELLEEAQMQTFCLSATAM